MTLIDRQIEVIAGACAVTPETVRAVIAGERVGSGPDERVRAALSLIGFTPPLPRPSQNLDLFVDPVEQAVLAMRYNGNWPECLPHLACGGCGCQDCIGGARRCGACVHRVAITTVEDGTPLGMDVCGWCNPARRKDTGDETLSVVARGHVHCVNTGNCGEAGCPMPAANRPGALRRLVSAILGNAAP